MIAAAGEGDARRRRLQITQPLQRVRRGIVQVNEDRRQRDQVTFRAPLVTGQPVPAQANRDERAPAHAIGRQQTCQRLVQQVGAIQRDMTRRRAMLPVGMDGGQRQTSAVAVVAGTCQQRIQKAADLRFA